MDAFEHDNHLCIVAPRMWRDVRALLRAQPNGRAVAPEVVRRIGRDVAHALATMHSAADGIATLHRDIKPENILITADPLGGEFGAKLSDFGLASPLPPAALRRMREGARSRAREPLPGTPQYWPPEILDTGWTPEADVFALTAVLYELPTGKHFLARTVSEATLHVVLEDEVRLGAALATPRCQRSCCPRGGAEWLFPYVGRKGSSGRDDQLTEWPKGPACWSSECGGSTVSATGGSQAQYRKRDSRAASRACGRAQEKKENLVRRSGFLKYSAVAAAGLGVACTPSAPKITPQPVRTAASGSASRRGGTVTEASASDAVSFHVYKTTDQPSRDYQFRVFASGLWQRDPNTNLPAPYMAKSWTVSDDGRTYTFALRDDMKWSDGVPITAEDFVWTYQQARNPENKYPYLSILNDFASYTARDARTVVVTLKDPNCTGLLSTGQITPLPKHVWEKLDWNDPQKNPEVTAPTVVSGPWKLKEWRRDEFASFVPNPTFFGGSTMLDLLVTRIVPQAAVQFQMLKSGDVDSAPVGANDFPEASRAANLALYQWDPAQPIWYFLGFNLRQPVVQNVLVRRALSHAMPRDAIAQQVFGGLAKPAYSTYSPGTWAYEPNVPKYEYSLERANALLDQAGLRRADSARRGADGNPLKLRIISNATDRQRERIALIAQEEFRKAGVDSEVTQLEPQAYSDYMRNRLNEWDVWVGLSRDTSDPHFMSQAWSQATIPDVNPGAYVNAQVDELYARANRPPCGQENRKPLYQQIQRIIADDQPYIFLVYQRGYAFANKRLEVNPPGALGISYRLHEWRLKS